MLHQPDSDPPFFFRRVWHGATTDLDEVVEFRKVGDTFMVDLTARSGDVKSRVPALSIVSPETPPGGLVIFGRKVQSTYAEDAEAMAKYERQGLVFAECFSVWCEDGELGSHPLATVTEISREEFEAARERGWT